MFQTCIIYSTLLYYESVEIIIKKCRRNDKSVEQIVCITWRKLSKRGEKYENVEHIIKAWMKLSNYGEHCNCMEKIVEVWRKIIEV